MLKLKLMKLDCSITKAFRSKTMMIDSDRGTEGVVNILDLTL